MLTNLEKLRESLKNLEDFSPEKLDILVGEMFKTLEGLESKIESTSPIEREAALQVAIDLKESLSKQASAIRESIDLKQTELDSFVENLSPSYPENK